MSTAQYIERYEHLKPKLSSQRETPIFNSSHVIDQMFVITKKILFLFALCILIHHGVIDRSTTVSLAIDRQRALLDIFYCYIRKMIYALQIPLVVPKT